MAVKKDILLGFAYQIREADGNISVMIRWKRLVASLILISFISWFTLAGALYFHFKYNKDYEDVSYYKMLTLLPFGIAEHRIQMGNYQIKKAFEELDENNYRAALRLLRQGVTRAPANLEGRIILSEFYEFALKRHDIAIHQLIEGLDHGGIKDSKYLRHTIGVLLRHQKDDDIQVLADKYLSEEVNTLNEEIRVLAFGAASANHLRGNYDRADEYLINYKLLDFSDGVILSAKNNWDRGNRIAAITILKQSLNTIQNSGPLLLQLSRYHREIGENDKARRYAMLNNVSSPLSIAPRIELLYIYHASKETALVKRETQRMLKQFDDNESALTALTNFAADTGNIDLARRTYEISLENELSVDVFALLLIEAHLVDEDYAGALEFSEELLKERPNWVSEKWGIFNALRSVASYGIGRADLGEIYLQDFLNEKIEHRTYIAVAKRFSRIDCHEQSNKILDIAHLETPTSQIILSELIRNKLTLGYTENLYNLISRFLLMRRPDLDLLNEAYRKLGSDRFIFTENRESLLLQISAALRQQSRSAFTSLN